jgi:hypothetical protein
VFERDAIRAALDPPVPDPTLPEELAASALADQIEHIRIIPTTLNSEEMSRLWTALQAQYRATAAYDVGVVLIDGSDPARPPLPVGERGVVVDPLARPRVHHVVAAPAPGESVDPTKPITAAGTVWIRGQGLKGAATRVVIGRTEAQPLGDAVADTRIELDLATIAGLRAGVQTALVVHERDLGIPPVGHEVLTSNSVPVVVRPDATVTAGVDDTDAVDGVTFAEGTFTCTVDPPVGPDQRVLLLLNERDAPPGRPPRGYSLMARPGNGIAAGDETATDVPVPFAGVAEGTYLARIEVDGAAGLLTADADGRFDSPAVTV